MYNRIREIIEKLTGIEERACRIGFNTDDAMQHTKLIRELKIECEVNNLDSKELVKTLPLAKISHTSLTING